MNDSVNNPAHYAAGSSIECIDAMFLALGDKATIDFCMGNAFKYMWRHKLKGTPKEDLKKAEWYLNKAEELCKLGPFGEIEGRIYDFRNIWNKVWRET